MPNPCSQDDLEPTEGLLGQTWLPAGWSELNVAVGLSGGADSMALLRALIQLKQQQGGEGLLIALHVNHQLRGAESTEDAQWCQQQCDLLDLPLEVLACKTTEYAVEIGEGIEAAARAQRYQLLTTAAELSGVRYLATAHTQDDQVETVLFRLLRGTGLRGLAGIPRSRALSRSLTLIRPLLDCSRAKVTDYLAELSQTYRTDSTNADSRFTRNRLRHELLPLLREQYNKELDLALVRLASQAGESQNYVEEQAQRLLDAGEYSAKPQALILGRPIFSGQPQVVVCEALRLAWRKAGLAEQSMSHPWWSQLAEMLQQSHESTVLNLPGNVRASISGERLFLEW